MNKTLRVSALALAAALVGAAAVVQAQDASGRSEGPAAQQASSRGGHDGGWHHARHGGERFARGGRHGGRDVRGRHGGGRNGGDPRRLLETFDANGDGAVTQAEVDQFRQGQIAQFDANSDGVLSLEEYQALWLERMRERMVDAFQAHDDDGDGQVTSEEFNERFSGLVDRLDRNGDGQLDASDRGRNRRTERTGGPAQPQENAAPETAPGTTPAPESGTQQ